MVRLLRLSLALLTSNIAEAVSLDMKPFLLLSVLGFERSLLVWFINSHTTFVIAQPVVLDTLSREQQQMRRVHIFLPTLSPTINRIFSPAFRLQDGRKTFL